MAELASWLRCLSPIPAVMEVLGQGDVGSFGLSAGAGAVGRYVLLALVGQRWPAPWPRLRASTTASSIGRGRPAS